MKTWVTFVALAFLLGACGPTTSVGKSGSFGGRFEGVGVFDAGRMWSQIATPSPRDPGSATTSDDQHVIVVVDTNTGEVRECGDLSGRCASINPWTKTVSALPAQVLKHAADLDAEPPNGGDSASARISPR